MVETGKLNGDEEFNLEILKQMLYEKFNSVDFEQVKTDARKFIFKNENLEYYSRELFLDVLKRM